MGPFKKYVTCIMAFFNPLNFVKFRQFYSTTSPVSLTKLHRETIEWEGKIFFANMAVLAYHVISTEAEKHIFKHNWIFRHSCIYKQPTLTKLWNFHIFCKYYIVILDTLVSSFLDILFLLLAVILSELHEKPRRKDWVTGQSA